MNRHPPFRLLSLLLFASALQAQPTPQATAAFDDYIATVEARLATQHQSPAVFLAPESDTRLQHSDPIVEQLTPRLALPGALLHHWRASAFAPAATAAGLERLLRDFNHYPQVFAPQVLQASILSGRGDQLQANLRVRQHHILTVVMDSTYNVSFGRLDPLHGFSASRSVRLAEIASPGTAAQHALAPAEEHGFLWRQNTYWTWEQRDGGLFLQIESISLSRSIPRGLGWAVQPFVESVPRESLEFTLRSICNALHPQPQTERTN